MNSDAVFRGFWENLKIDMIHCNPIGLKCELDWSGILYQISVIAHLVQQSVMPW